LITKTEVLVQVKACGLNPIDFKILYGNFDIISKDFPIIPCFDIAGVVIETGIACKRLRVGDAVYGMAKFLGPRYCGGAAEFIAISERCCAKMPRNLTFLEAASIPMVGMTTIQSIGRYAKDNHKILVLGGSGGCGSFAVQYCKAKGCYVVATCGERNMNLLIELGADRVINYAEENWWEVLSGENFDAIFDTVGGAENWENSARVLKKKGAFATISGDKQDKFSVGNIASLVANYIGRNAKSLVGNPSYSHITTDPTKANTQLIEVRGLIEGNHIKPVIKHENNAFNLENMVDAFNQIIDGHTTGKISIMVDGDANKRFDDL